MGRGWGGKVKYKQKPKQQLNKLHSSMRCPHGCKMICPCRGFPTRMVYLYNIIQDTPIWSETLDIKIKSVTDCSTKERGKTGTIQPHAKQTIIQDYDGICHTEQKAWQQHLVPSEQS